MTTAQAKAAAAAGVVAVSGLMVLPTGAGAATATPEQVTQAAQANEATVTLMPNLPAGAKLVASGMKEGSNAHPAVVQTTAACDYRQWKWSPGMQLQIAGTRLASSRVETVWSEGFCTLFTTPPDWQEHLTFDVTSNGRVLGWQTPSQEWHDDWFWNWNGIDHSAHHHAHQISIGNVNPLVGDKHLAIDVDVYADGFGCMDLIDGVDNRQCWQF